MSCILLNLKNYKAKARHKVLASRSRDCRVCKAKNGDQNTGDSKASGPKNRDHKDRNLRNRDHKDRDHKDRDHKDRDPRNRDHKDRDPRNRDPWKYAVVLPRYCGDFNVLQERLQSIEAQLESYKQSEEAETRFLETKESEHMKELEVLLRARADAIDAYFSLPSEAGKKLMPVDVFVENGSFVLRLSVHFVIRNKKPIALRARRQQILAELKKDKAGKTNRQLRAEAAEKARCELSDMPDTRSSMESAAKGIAQAITNLSDLCESGDGTAVIGGVKLPVRTELLSISQGNRAQKGALNIKLYSQRPEVRKKLSFEYNVSHAYLGTAVIPYMSDLVAKMGLCSLCINRMMDLEGGESPHLQTTAIHELLHTFGLQDQYRHKGEKSHPNIADNDIMYTIGSQARIHDYAFNKILVMAKRLKL